MSRLAALFLPIIASLASLSVACTPDEGATTEERLPTTPSECDGLPSLGEARRRLVVKMDEASAGGVVVEPKSGFRGEVPLGVGFALDGRRDDGSVVEGVEPLLLRSKEQVEQYESLKGSINGFDVDWSKEALLLMREKPREALYRYVVRGSELLVIAARATPCLAARDLESFSLGAAELRVLRVPSTLTTARVSPIEERYRLAMPGASGGCRRADTPAAFGAGTPSLARGPDGTRLYFGGFSAMTGNVFFGASKDGGAFTPNGWDEGHLSRFEGRGPYAGVYEPFVEHVGSGWRMTAEIMDTTDESKDGWSVSVITRTLVEMTSADGLAWSPGKKLLPPTRDPASDRRGPSRITVDGEDRLYFATNGAIHVARRRGTADFVEDTTPVLTPPDDLDAYDALGYYAPEIARVGARFVLFYTVRWGGLSPSYAWRFGVGHAVSDDGVTFTRATAPLLVPELEDEAGGLGSPAALVDGDALSLFFTAVNRRFEPSVKRAACTLP